MSSPHAPIAALLLALASCGGPTLPDPGSDAVLVYTRTMAFRHESIIAGVGTLGALATENDLEIYATQDPDVFNATDLARFRVVVFLNTTGDVLDEAGQAALRDFVSSGGGWVGVHAAADTEYDWPWYGELVGAWFRSHPAPQSAAVEVVDSTHPSTRALPTRWERTDEWYDFRSDPTDRVQVLARVDETTYDGGAMGASHPIAWYRRVGQGRAWYTAMGHTTASYAEPLFRAHLIGGVSWAGGWSEDADPR